MQDRRAQPGTGPTLPEGLADAVGGALDVASLRGTLTAAISRVCPPQLAGEREDLVQNALVRLVSILRRDGKAVNATYVWRSAYSVMLDELRRARRRHEVPMNDETADTMTAAAPDPERSAHAARIGEAVRLCMGQLAAPRRHALTLHFLGYSPKESGARLGWGAKRISNLVYRGLADVKRCLQQKGVEP